MAVKIGSASIDERGKATGGQAGDQTGREVKTQNWYKHKKLWYVYRAKSAIVRELIAQNMEWACANNDIGYDQNQRNSLYVNVKPFDFDCRKTTKPVETDCSALVRVCVQYAFDKAGISYTVGNFRTATQSTYLMQTGQFDKLTDDNHCNKSDYLARGDILCTRTSGHTVVVLTNGSKCDAGDIDVPVDDSCIKYGDTGDAVKQLQCALIKLGYDLGSWGADGEFGDDTRKAVMQFQSENGLEIDGIAGKNTQDRILTLLNTDKKVIVTGRCVNVRKRADTTAPIMGVVTKGEKLTFCGVADNGWYIIRFGDSTAYISNKYAQIGD